MPGWIIAISDLSSQVPPIIPQKLFADGFGIAAEYPAHFDFTEGPSILSRDNARCAPCRVALSRWCQRPGVMVPTEKITEIRNARMVQ